MMTDYYDAEGNLISDGGSLRKQLEETLEQNKQLAKQVEQFQKNARQSTVEAVVASRNLPSKLIDLVPADVSDKSAVEKWLDNYADVFAPQGQSQEKQPEQAQQENLPKVLDVPAPGTNLTTEQAFEVFQQILAGAQPATLPDGRDPQEALQKAYEENGSQGMEDFLRSQGLS
jgi:hypothetical protein